MKKSKIILLTLSIFALLLIIQLPSSWGFGHDTQEMLKSEYNSFKSSSGDLNKNAIQYGTQQKCDERVSTLKTKIKNLEKQLNKIKNQLIPELTTKKNNKKKCITIHLKFKRNHLTMETGNANTSIKDKTFGNTPIRVSVFHGTDIYTITDSYGGFTLPYSYLNNELLFNIVKKDDDGREPYHRCTNEGGWIKLEKTNIDVYLMSDPHRY